MQDQLLSLGYILPSHWHFCIILTESRWFAATPLVPSQGSGASQQRQNSMFLALLAWYHHQIRVHSSHDLSCFSSPPSNLQYSSSPHFSRRSCVYRSYCEVGNTLSELHGFYHPSISHFQYVSVALMEKYGSPPVVKIIPLISHRW